MRYCDVLLYGGRVTLLLLVSVSTPLCAVH